MKHKIWHQDQLHCLMTPCPGTDQSAKIDNLKGHTWKDDAYSIEP